MLLSFVGANVLWLLEKSFFQWRGTLYSEFQEIISNMAYGIKDISDMQENCHGNITASSFMCNTWNNIWEKTYGVSTCMKAAVWWGKMSVRPCCHCRRWWINLFMTLATQLTNRIASTATSRLLALLTVKTFQISSGEQPSIFPIEKNSELPPDFLRWP